MKASHTCPKCKSTDILVGSKNTQRAYALGVTIMSNIFPMIYVCKNCGYIEEYFDEKALKKLLQK